VLPLQFLLSILFCGTTIRLPIELRLDPAAAEIKASSSPTRFGSDAALLSEI